LLSIILIIKAKEGKEKPLTKEEKADIILDYKTTYGEKVKRQRRTDS
ncbi:hypothetical protein FOXB_06425, partial [Fusarium oxysporum f. sp. conglutinans Fo5176]